MSTGRGTTFYAGQEKETEQIYHVISVLLGSVSYGVYLTLFLMGMPIIFKRAQRSSSWTFLTGTMIIFMFTTAYIVIAMYRFSMAYGLHVSRPELAVTYYHNTRGAWDGVAHTFLINFTTWTADILLIYRCFLICERRILVILPSCFLFLGSISVGIYTTIFTINPTIVTAEQAAPFYTAIFPLNIAISTTTTGLIVLFIHRQHRASRKVGLHQDSGYYSSGVSLLYVIKIVVESACVYAVQQVLLLALFLAKEPAQVLFHGTLLPSIGVVFLLMAIRTHSSTQPRSHATLNSDLMFLPHLSPNAEGNDSVLESDGTILAQRNSQDPKVNKIWIPKTHGVGSGHL
ncbi:hypothetical protein FA15DRAFT_707019 [Coprinopsis marcescibilis]|uniref:Uncharacterized protein n=1 Tax=Coprinopsis marcescibilis TaxID=230819 RepID=A0A5C3KNL0_COPMA|nr:hypothetical protein FA15DRAFT_707019 [Coprinopsis marcescibilis]